LPLGILLNGPSLVAENSLFHTPARRFLGFFRAEYLNACKIELEHTRANANDELIETLRDYERDEGFRFYQMQKEWDDQLKDPDDVFFAAKDRKEEIKERMKNLQSGLDRMKPKKKKASSTRRKRTSRKSSLGR
jgi:hypothetical protein